MISTPTVLILGAGASHHCGYPLGRELVADLCRLRRSDELSNLPEKWPRDDVNDFLDTLSYSDPSSIDAFLERNRDQAQLGKFLIARELKKREQLNRLFPPNDAGWYRYLFDSLLVNGSPDFEKNALTVVTFNYDRSLEAYLLSRLMHGYSLSQPQATEVLNTLPIIHVHGILGQFPKTTYGVECTTDELMAIAEQIQIIHEIRDIEDGYCNTMFQNANIALNSAERIYFLGFGFHTANLRRFQFFSPESTAGKTIRATANGFGRLDLEQLQKRLGEFGFSENSFHAKACNWFFSHVAGLE